MRMTAEMYVTRFFVCLLCLISGSYGFCTDIHADSTKVANMCTDSVVSGTEVYIDAGLATNVPSASGPVCSCRVEADPVNSINITSYYGGVPHSDCGTTLSYVVDGQPFRNVSCKDDHVDISSMNMVTNFFKIKSPYDSNYCTKIQLIYCQNTEFKCSDGTCIHVSGRCDNKEDCADKSDENDCNPVTCLEGKVACDDGLKCILPSQRCDGKTDCPDASDESASCGSSTSSSLQSTLSPTTPLVTVTCTKNLHSGGDPPSKDGSCNVRCIVIVLGVAAGIMAIIVAALIIKTKSTSSSCNNQVTDGNK